MLWLFGAIYKFLVDSIVDFVFFVLVDAVAKTPLKEARTEEEKRTIWLMESLALGVVCLLIYMLDHTPYVGLTLTLTTLMYTQLAGKIKIRTCWRNLFERWEEHQHHTENVQLINEKQKCMEMWRKISMPAPVSKPVLNRLTDFITRKSEAKMNAPVNPVFSMNKMFVPPYPAPETQQNVGGMNPSVGAINNPGMSVSPDFLQNNTEKPKAFEPSSSQNYESSPAFSSTPNSKASIFQPDSSPIRPVSSWLGRADLKRRPLRTFESRESPQYSFSNTQSNIRNRFMSAFGYKDKSQKPAGLRNEGQNLCFLNCVIQCLSRTPGLVDKLYWEINHEQDCSAAESAMISALTELMDQCKKMQADGVLDPTQFRAAVAQLNSGLVVAPTVRQYQQDTAEFFMWLMESLHNALKKTPNKDVEADSNLVMLKFIYGDLSDRRISDLKKACRREIDSANGLNNDSYAEPIQRLSDLEWLTYKQSNHSVVDNLFTGQLVEAYHCLIDNHLTVTTQTFNILPVPIVCPRDLSGLVHLEDCFTKFCNVEHLAGTEGFQCGHCNKTNSVANHCPPSGHQKNLRSKVVQSSQGSVDSAFHSTLLSNSSCMSPIPRPDGLNDSGFHDNVFRTSTPVGEGSRFVFASRSIREIERRCLLRQLPECLVIQLMRFSYNQFTQQSRKINSAVSIPVKGLDLTSIVYDNVTNREDMSPGQRVKKYDLYGVCVHLGAESTNFGHYICYCLSENGIWYKFDDELVWEVNIDYEMTTREIRENAYLLFYKRAKDV
ncbi:uncharacterized protein LOC127859507 [Dreissena polymorpha]|nr:uncharacterized protein LOC127859507 [Dreissena polymorpha]